MSLIVKIDPIKTKGHLKKAIPYIMNEAKTYGLTYSNVGVTAGEIIEGFFLTKERYKERIRGTREGYHVKFSFSKDTHVDPQKALEYAKEWADTYLDSQYDYVTAVHNDRDHLHMHLIFNSVSLNGKKFRMDKNEVRDKIRPLTNELCIRYGFDTLRERKENLDYSNVSSWGRIVERDIDECIKISKSYADFKIKMINAFGYTLREGVSREHGLYLSLTPPGKAKAIRTQRLSDGYMPADIEERISKNPVWRKVKKEYIPFAELSIYQKDFIKKYLVANRLYRKTGSSKHMHEVSVAALRRLKKDYRDFEMEVTKNIKTIKEHEKKQIRSKTL